MTDVRGPGGDLRAAFSRQPPDGGTPSAQRWLSWLVGLAVLGGLVSLVVHSSEERDFVLLARNLGVWWLAAASVLQAATYLAQGDVWRRMGAAAGHRLSRRDAIGLSLAKLFADQALPSGGISGSVLVAAALERRRMPRAAVHAAVLVNLVGFHAAYVLALGAALAILHADGGVPAVVGWTTGAFLAYAIGLSAAMVALPGRALTPAGPVARFGLVRSSLQFAEGADATLVRSPALLSTATGLQLAIVLLDAATLWTLVQALGIAANPARLFAGFMVASLVRTVGIVPGGLGTFDAVAVLALRSGGVPLHVALSATLLFRGLSFWIPMAPGFWLSRHEVGPATQPAPGVAVLDRYWTRPPEEVLEHLRSGRQGLTTADARARLEQFGPNAIRERAERTRIRILADQLRSPLLLLLVFAAAASAVTGAWVDAAIVATVVTATVAIGYRRESGAEAAVAALQARVRVRATVVRDGLAAGVPLEEIVPGDVIQLAAGNLVPADAVVLDGADFFVSEAALTGESLPVEKRPGPATPAAALGERTGCVFLGTNVRSGAARCVVVSTGRRTELGGIAHRLALRPPEAEFDRGIRHFGLLLTSAMLVIVLLVFFAHVARGRPPAETLLFAVALAVGLSPELLPAILNVNLARGAQMMARRGVVVRRLSAIENLGSMDVLCTDKTGTITEGVVRLDGAFDADGRPAPHVQRLGAINAAFETGLATPLDDAILAAEGAGVGDVVKLAEIPFDFVRKRVSVVVQDGSAVRLVTKGAFERVLEIAVRTADGRALDEPDRAALRARFEAWSLRGIRVLAVGTRRIAPGAHFGREDERELTFEGFLTFLDRPKDSAAEALRSLAAHGVVTKIITGDHRLVAAHVASLVGMPNARLLTGEDIQRLDDVALGRAAETTDLFVEVDPGQKERIIRALKTSGHVVGFLGDGVNDAPAMHVADTSLSVEQSVDVARQAADFVLLERDLDVIRGGIEEGRRTFANTLKYILITTSANLGNMLSMALASLFLPFLPLLASQILLNNFVSDIPAVGLADDSVDPEMVARPERWDTRFIGRYMLVFGLVSSLFDLVTFAVLLGPFHAAADRFRSGWFVESLLTELVIALVVRTRRPFYRSRPGRVLLWTTLALIPVTFAIPALPYAGLLGFVPLPPALVATIVVITALYVVTVEAAKQRFYRAAVTPPATRPPTAPATRARPAWAGGPA